MPDNEKLIEEAAKALDWNFNPDKHPIMAAMFRDYASTCLAVFERAHTPTEDDRADAEQRWPIPLNYETCTYCGKGFPRPVSLHHDEAECVPRGEPSEAQVIVAVDAFMASQMESEDGPALVHKNMAAALRAARGV